MQNHLWGELFSERVLIDTYRCLMQNQIRRHLHFALSVLIDTYRCLMQNKTPLVQQWLKESLNRYISLLNAERTIEKDKDATGPS